MGNLIALGSWAGDHDAAPGKQHAERAVYTVFEVAQLLSLSRGTAYALVRDGTIPLCGWVVDGWFRVPDFTRGWTTWKKKRTEGGTDESHCADARGWLPRELA